MQAKDALDAGEVPVGCVIVRNGQVVGRGQNMPNRMKDVRACVCVRAFLLLTFRDA